MGKKPDAAIFSYSAVLYEKSTLNSLFCRYQQFVGIGIFCFCDDLAVFSYDKFIFVCRVMIFPFRYNNIPHPERKIKQSAW